MGELHLEIIKHKLVKDRKVSVKFGTPRVSYRETITTTALDVRGRFIKQTGGRGQFGDVVINVTPINDEEAKAQELKMTDGIVFVDKITGGNIPRSFMGELA